MLNPKRGHVRVATAAFAGLLTGALALAAPALAVDPTKCTKGYNNANTAWGTCTGRGEWRVVTWCYYAGSTNSGWYGWSDGGTHTAYSSCKSPSHVTDIFIEAR
ncbi:hypothetical protein ABUL04_05910 [Micromonospora harpali]|uniref:Uncharacterized protein n=2 Tax=Micromonospora TaxID=1873 RepID=A0A0D0VIR3_9ACTN|nr:MULTISPECIES: hypothetical protein [Micromonospora]KIR60663.1 hypothetical protein TK50_22495 [Micromonospora haikouensis]